MNGRADKRIRIAARIISRSPEVYRKTIKRLKREYRVLPYHRRNLPVAAGDRPCKESHSALLRRLHKLEAA